MRNFPVEFDLSLFRCFKSTKYSLDATLKKNIDAKVIKLIFAMLNVLGFNFHLFAYHLTLICNPSS